MLHNGRCRFGRDCDLGGCDLGGRTVFYTQSLDFLEICLRIFLKNPEIFLKKGQKVTFFSPGKKAIGLKLSMNMVNKVHRNIS